MNNVVWIKDTELFAAPYDEDMVQKARDYIIDMNLSSDDVKLVKRGEQVLVITKRDVGQETGQRGNSTEQG